MQPRTVDRVNERRQKHTYSTTTFGRIFRWTTIDKMLDLSAALHGSKASPSAIQASTHQIRRAVLARAWVPSLPWLDMSKKKFMQMGTGWAVEIFKQPQ